MPVYPNTGQYDIDLNSTGDGWNGTFAGIIRHTADDILDDGPYGPVSIVYEPSEPARRLETMTGTLTRLMRDDPSFDYIEVQEDGALYVIDIETVRRFRA